MSDRRPENPLARRRRRRTPRHWNPRATGILLVTVLAVALSLLAPTASASAAAAPGSAATAPSRPGDDRAEIRPALLKTLETGDKADFWVRLDALADLSDASQIPDWDERGAAVVAALKETAETSQREVVEALDEAGVTYRSFWATNAVLVEDGSQSLAQSLTGIAAVDSLWPSRTYGEVEPIREAAKQSPQAVEWGIANIKADDVWAEGTTGEGVVIANIDSGVQYDHPALVDQYRGNNGDGTFTQDYNWFDVSGRCPDGPCDANGHGTHTMGTMLGSDGDANQIGVAPGATWIAANGCDTCSDADLIESGQWMLAPTKVDGSGPDPAKRPNVINNSWGSQMPSNDPFMEDISEAWAASGIFGVFSNGNSGPDCQTSGRPGSRAINYSVGAYDADNAIAPFSSRGSGQDGAVKPDISAPGVDVRSSLPGSDYGLASGTSMAAPHLAGAIALLWSAEPELIGDIDLTRELLDETAVDDEDLTCGGTADDNNVYGEGRLDALALVHAGDLGPTGMLGGEVTDASSGEPIAEASVHVVGGPVDKPVDRTVTAGADDSYDVRLPVGDYEVTGQAYGYESETASVTVAEDASVEQDFSLTAAATATVSGTVTDGSGQGWPLYAKITVAGVPHGAYFTEPATGDYSFTLPAGTSYDVKVEPIYPGYQTVHDTITLDDDLTHDVSAPVDDTTCTARGYTYRYQGAAEGFDTAAVPAGWEVIDHIDTGHVWTVEDGVDVENQTGGDGGYAEAPTDTALNQRQDTSLITAAADLSSVTKPVVQFHQHYDDLGPENADVDLSLDGGDTWETVLHQEADARGPRLTVVPVPQAAGQPNVKVRFHFGPATYNWWTWQLDDVFVGNRTCEPDGTGGYVVGNVLDANTDAGVDGATVTIGDTSVRTDSTPDDDGQDDGFYWAFIAAVGDQSATASASQYQPDTQTMHVDGVTRTDFTLEAGRLSVTPASVRSSLELGDRTATRTFTVTNTGTAPATLRLGEGGEDFSLQTDDDKALTRREVTSAPGAPLQRLDVPVSIAARPVSRGHEAPASEAEPTGPSAAPWTDISDHPAPVMDNRVVTVDGIIYSVGGVNGPGITSGTTWAYDPATLAWKPVSDLPEPRAAMTVGAIDGQIVASGGWGSGEPETATVIYDPETDRWSAAADNPAPTAAAGQAVLDGKLYAVGGCTTGSCTPMSDAVLAYDPAKDSWERLADYPRAVAFVSCGGLNGMVVCSGGSDGVSATKQTWGYDPKSDSWTRLADAPIDSWGSSYAVGGDRLVVVGGVQGATVTNAANAYDPASDTWTTLPNANTARYRGGAACGFYKIGGSSGGFSVNAASEQLPGFGDCATGAADVAWLSIDRPEADLAVGESTTVEVTMRARVDQPGTYTAGVTLKEDTPYAVRPVSATMTVTPPGRWGKLTGVVRAVACDGTTVPLGGAVVQVYGSSADWTLRTRADGSYAQWIDSRDNPLSVYAADDGYKPTSRTASIAAGETAKVDFGLRKIGCPAAPATRTSMSLADAFPPGRRIHAKVTVAADAGTPTGRVRVLSGERELGTATLRAGRADVSLDTSRLQAGHRTITVRYAGSPGFSASTASRRVTVTKAVARTRATTSAHRVRRGAHLRIVATVRAAGLRPTGTVVVTYHGRRVGQARLASGRAVITVRTRVLPVGKRVLTVRYSGNGQARVSTDRLRVVVRPRR